ncbi:hypothetical protein YSA_02610 [Pseudomonas putida ND6]|uniref:Uncharacterized protein n=1 Tax=Pseudomonas putida ND6 TaxID=231023 RepID=I3URR6_PSEPU|nr:hypothetical protein YSA_02610 [Pseudomonas putida ND6]
MCALGVMFRWVFCYLVCRIGVSSAKFGQRRRRHQFFLFCVIYSACHLQDISASGVGTGQVTSCLQGDLHNKNPE